MRELEAKHPSLKRGGEFSPSCSPRYIQEAEKWEMRDLEAKHPSLKRWGEVSPFGRPR
jgi:hypothetical protein